VATIKVVLFRLSQTIRITTATQVQRQLFQIAGDQRLQRYSGPTIYVKN